MAHDAEPTPPSALPDGVRPEDVTAVVEHIAASATLGRSEQLVRFLRFVVGETLAGRGPLLKEYTIGVAALGRAPKFDPAADSVVRVQARQLRFKLAEYFANEGHAEPVQIELPKGSYAAVFIPRASSVERRRWSPSLWTYGGTIAAVAVVAAVAIPRVGAAGGGRSRGARADDARASVVVLPFLNLTGDPGEDYVSDGVTDELTTSLARVPGLRVVARTSAFQFKTRPADVRSIGRQLGVDDVIEGSVQRTGNVVRITVQLIRARDGVHQWAASFDEPANNLLRAEDEVARAIVDAFGRTRSPAMALAPPKQPTRDAEAYVAYLKARYYHNRRDAESMGRAITLFQQAIDRDTSFALAYAGLAGAYVTMAINGLTQPGVSPPLAERAARRALALDSTLAEAHGALGSLRAFVGWDWAGADSEYQRAIELGPGVASAHSGYAITLMARGRLDEALAQLHYAQRLDPLSRPIAYSIGEALVYARRWNEAIAQAHLLLELDSTSLGAYNLLWRAYAATGRYTEALDAMAKQHDTVSTPIALAPLGRVREARERIALDRRTDGDRVPYFIACLYAALGDRDSAFIWLDRAYAAHQTDIVSMKIDPMMDPLRTDPRFDGLLRRIGLSN